RSLTSYSRIFSLLAYPLFIFYFSFFFSSRRRHTRWPRDWSSDVCSSDLRLGVVGDGVIADRARLDLVAELLAPRRGVALALPRAQQPPNGRQHRLARLVQAWVDVLLGQQTLVSGVPVPGVRLDSHSDGAFKVI